MNRFFICCAFPFSLQTSHEMNFVGQSMQITSALVLKHDVKLGFTTMNAFTEKHLCLTLK